MNKAYPTYKQALSLLLIWLGCIAICALPVILHVSIDNAIGLSILYTLPMILTVAIGLSLRRNWRFKTSSFPVTLIFISLLSVLSCHIILEPLQSIGPISEALLKLFRNIHDQPYAFFFMAVVAAPLLEEALFRGIILDGFLKNYKPWHAIFASALLFAVIHGNLTQGIGAFVLGILFGWIYWNTNSIIPCILLHFINNLIAFVANLSSAEEDFNMSLRESMSDDIAYGSLYVFSILIAVGSVYVIQKKYFSKMRSTRVMRQNEV
jgi:membrane protease YdiL (CAAX protease family)